MDLIELRAAVGCWATTQLRQEGRLTEQRFTDLINIVFGHAGPAG